MGTGCKKGLPSSGGYSWHSMTETSASKLIGLYPPQTQQKSYALGAHSPALLKNSSKLILSVPRSTEMLSFGIRAAWEFCLMFLSLRRGWYVSEGTHLLAGSRLPSNNSISPLSVVKQLTAGCKKDGASVNPTEHHGQISSSSLPFKNATSCP